MPYSLRGNSYIAYTELSLNLRRDTTRVSKGDKLGIRLVVQQKYEI